MNFREVLLCFGPLAFAGSCWADTTSSGTYVARGQGFAELLQITQTKDGRLIGTLSHAALKPGGALEQTRDGLTGAVDGRSITLVINAPLSLGSSMSGTIDANGITLAFASGSERFSMAQPSEYQAVVQQLKAEGNAIQQRLSAAQAQAQRVKLVLDQDASVADLNKRLTEYAARVTGTAADDQQKAFHAAHEKALAQARQLWQKEQALPRGSFQAGQVAFAIGQLSFKLDSFDYPLDDAPNAGRSHLAAYDEEIAKSLCRRKPDAALTHCFEQDAAVQAYESARPAAVKRINDLEATLRDDKATMKGIVDQAEAYSSSR